MRFIADAMLGRLARWLRLMGYDTLYIRDIEDRELLRKAKAGGRAILTRDTDFLRIKNLPECLFIEDDDPLRQLEEVIKAYGLRALPERRCANCNCQVTSVRDKREIEGLVPRHVYLSHTKFLSCAGCGNVYWEGSQQREFRRVMDRAVGGDAGADSK